MAPVPYRTAQVIPREAPGMDAYRGQREQLAGQRAQDSYERQTATYENAALREQVRQQKLALKAQKDAEKQALDESNTIAAASAQGAGISTSKDALGRVQADRNPLTGGVQMKQLSTGKQYDKAGREFELERGVDGVMRQKLTDKDADIGPDPDNPKDPNIYRKNRGAPWQGYDPKVGVFSSDPAVKKASQNHIYKTRMDELRDQLMIESTGMPSSDEILSVHERRRMLEDKNAGREYVGDPAMIENTRKFMEGEASIKAKKLEWEKLRAMTPDQYGEELRKKATPEERAAIESKDMEDRFSYHAEVEKELAGEQQRLEDMRKALVARRGVPMNVADKEKFAFERESWEIQKQAWETRKAGLDADLKKESENAAKLNKSTYAPATPVSDDEMKALADNPQLMAEFAQQASLEKDGLDAEMEAFAKEREKRMGTATTEAQKMAFQLWESRNLAPIQAKQQQFDVKVAALNKADNRRNILQKAAEKDAMDAAVMKDPSLKPMADAIMGEKAKLEETLAAAPEDQKQKIYTDYQKKVAEIQTKAEQPKRDLLGLIEAEMHSGQMLAATNVQGENDPAIIAGEQAAVAKTELMRRAKWDKVPTSERTPAELEQEKLRRRDVNTIQPSANVTPELRQKWSKLTGLPLDQVNRIVDDAEMSMFKGIHSNALWNKLSGGSYAINPAHIWDDKKMKGEADKLEPSEQAAFNNSLKEARNDKDQLRTVDKALSEYFPTAWPSFKEKNAEGRGLDENIVAFRKQESLDEGFWMSLVPGHMGSLSTVWDKVKQGVQSAGSGLLATLAGVSEFTGGPKTEFNEMARMSSERENAAMSGQNSLMSTLTRVGAEMLPFAKAGQMVAGGARIFGAGRGAATAAAERFTASAGKLASTAPAAMAAEMVALGAPRAMAPALLKAFTAAENGSSKLLMKLATEYGAGVAAQLPMMQRIQLAVMAGLPTLGGVQNEASGVYTDAALKEMMAGVDVSKLTPEQLERMKVDARDRGVAKARGVAALSGALVGAVAMAFPAGKEKLFTALANGRGVGSLTAGEMGQAIGSIGLRDVFKSGTFREGMKAFVKLAAQEGKGIAKGTLDDAAEELLEQLPQDIIASMSYNPSMTIEQIVSNALKSAGIGAVMGFEVSSSMSAVKALQNAQGRASGDGGTTGGATPTAPDDGPVPSAVEFLDESNAFHESAPTEALIQGMANNQGASPDFANLDAAVSEAQAAFEAAPEDGKDAAAEALLTAQEARREEVNRLAGVNLQVDEGALNASLDEIEAAATGDDPDMQNAARLVEVAIALHDADGDVSLLNDVDKALLQAPGENTRPSILEGGDRAIFEQGFLDNVSAKFPASAKRLPASELAQKAVFGGKEAKAGTPKPKAAAKPAAEPKAEAAPVPTPVPTPEPAPAPEPTPEATPEAALPAPDVQEALKQILEAGTPAPALESIEDSLSYIRPAIKRFAPAFGGKPVKYTMEPMESGGLAVQNGQLIVSLPDLRKTIKAFKGKTGTIEKWAQLTMREEGIHAIVESAARDGDLDMSALVKALEDEGLKSVVATFRADTPENQAHEFIAALVAERIQLKADGNWVIDGKEIRGEEMNDPQGFYKAALAALKQLRDYFKKLLSGNPTTEAQKVLAEYLALIEARIEAFPDPEATPKNDRQTTEQAPNESASVPTGKKTVAIDGSRVQELMDSGLSKKDAVQQAIEEANPVGAKKNEQSATDKLAGAMAEPAAESPAPAAENTTQTTNEDGIETEEKDGQGQERNEQLPQLTPAPAAGGQSPVAEPSVAATKERKAKAMNKPPRKKKPKTIAEADAAVAEGLASAEFISGMREEKAVVARLENRKKWVGENAETPAERTFLSDLTKGGWDKAMDDIASGRITKERADELADAANKAGWIDDFTRNRFKQSEPSEAPEKQDHELTPNQFSEKANRNRSDKYNVPLSKVNEDYPVAKNAEDHWRLLQKAAEDGKSIPAIVLDNLPEERIEFLRKFHASSLPEGYFAPSVRKSGKQFKQEMVAARKAGREAAATPPPVEKTGQSFQQAEARDASRPEQMTPEELYEKRNGDLYKSALEEWKNSPQVTVASLLEQGASGRPQDGTPVFNSSKDRTPIGVVPSWFEGRGNSFSIGPHAVSANLRSKHSSLGIMGWNHGSLKLSGGKKLLLSDVEKAVAWVNESNKPQTTDDYIGEDSIDEQIDALNEAIAAKRPISVAAYAEHDYYVNPKGHKDGALPSGYVKRGELYVHESTPARDASRPEQMTPEELWSSRYDGAEGSLAKGAENAWWDKATTTQSRGSFTAHPMMASESGGKYTVRLGSGMKAKLKTFNSKREAFLAYKKQGAGSAGNALINAIEGTNQKQDAIVYDVAIASRKPVSAAAVDAYGIKLPEGYVKRGELYVHEGDSKPIRSAPVAGDDVARHSELEAKHNAGTITPAETAEAQKLVAVAARNSVAPNEDKWTSSGKSKEVFETLLWLNEERVDPSVFRYEKPVERAIEGRGIWGMLDEKMLPWFEADMRGEKELLVDWFLSENQRLDEIANGKEVTPPPYYGTNEYGRSLMAGVEKYAEFYKSSDPFTGTPLDQRFSPASNDIRRSSPAAPAPRRQVYSLKKEAVTQQREDRGLNPVPKGPSISEEQDDAAAKARLDKDELAGEKLTDRIINREVDAITSEDNAVLLMHYTRLQGMRNQQYAALTDGKLSKDERNRVTARLMGLESDMDRTELAARQRGTILGRALNSIKRMRQEDASFDGMRRKKEAAIGRKLDRNDPKDKALLDEIKRLTDSHAEKDAVVEKLTGELDKIRGEAGALAALNGKLEDAAKDGEKVDAGWMKKAKAYFDKTIKASASGLKSVFGIKDGPIRSAPVTDEAMVYASRLAAGLRARGVSNVDEMRQGFIDEVGPEIETHLEGRWDEIWDASDAAIEEMFEEGFGSASPKVKAAVKARVKKTDAPSLQQAHALDQIKQKAGEGSVPDDLNAQIQAMSLAMVRGGIDNVKDLVDAMHIELQKVFPDITREKTMRLLSRYGQRKELDPEPAKATKRQLDAQIRENLKVFGLEQTPPVPAEATGMEMPKPGPVLRVLKKLTKKALEKAESLFPEVFAASSAQNLQSIEDSIKTRLLNEIEELDIANSTMQPLPGKRGKREYSQANKDLLEKRNALRERYDRLFPKGLPDMKQQQASARESRDKRIKELEVELALGKVQGPKIRPVEMTKDDELQASYLETLKQERAANKPMASDAQRQAAWAASLDRSIKRLESDIRDGPSQNVEGKPLAENAEIEANKKRLKELRESVKKELFPEERENRLEKHIESEIERVKAEINGGVKPKNVKDPVDMSDSMKEKLMELEGLRETLAAHKKLTATATEEARIATLERSYEAGVKALEKLKGKPTGTPKPIDPNARITLAEFTQRKKNRELAKQIKAEKERIAPMLRDAKINAILARKWQQRERVTQQIQAIENARDIYLNAEKSGKPLTSQQKAELAASLRVPKDTSKAEERARLEKQAEVEVASAELAKSRQELINLQHEWEEMSRTFWDKAGKLGADMNRAAVLTGISTLEHLSGGGVSGVAASVARDAATATLRALSLAIPGLKAILDLTTHSGHVSFEATGALFAGTKKAGATTQGGIFRPASWWQAGVKGVLGKSNIDVYDKSGKPGHKGIHKIPSYYTTPQKVKAVVDMILESPGNLHASIKETFRQGHFAKAAVLEWNAAERRGEDTSDAVVMEGVLSRSLAIANREIMMGDNWQTRFLIKAVKLAARSEKVYPALGKIFANLMDFLIPVSNVPSSIVNRIASHIGGVPVGLIKLGHLASQGKLKGLASGKAKITEQEAEWVVEMLRNGMVGLALAAYAWTHAAAFGGAYATGEERRKRGKLKPGEIDLSAVFGMEGENVLNKHLTHDPLLSMMNYTAEMSRVAQSYVDDGDESGAAFVQSMPMFLMMLMEKNPNAAVVKRFMNPFKTGWEKTYETLLTPLSPVGLRQAAEYMDTDEEGEKIVRKQDSPGNFLKSGIPGLRETVPAKQTGRTVAAMADGFKPLPDGSTPGWVEAAAAWNRFVDKNDLAKAQGGGLPGNNYKNFTPEPAQSTLPANDFHDQIQLTKEEVAERDRVTKEGMNRRAAWVKSEYGGKNKDSVPYVERMRRDYRESAGEGTEAAYRMVQKRLGDSVRLK